MIGLAYSAKGARAAYFLGDIGVRTGLAIRNAQQGVPALFLESCADQVERKCKFLQFAAEVGVDLLLVDAEFFRGTDPHFVALHFRHFSVVEMQATKA